jgi:hypothetical protein
MSAVDCDTSLKQHTPVLVSIENGLIYGDLHRLIRKADWEVIYSKMAQPERCPDMAELPLPEMLGVYATATNTLAKNKRWVIKKINNPY